MPGPRRIPAIVASWLVAVGLVAPVTGVEAGATRPARITWLAATLPVGARVDLSKVASVVSTTRPTWTAGGACTISGSRVVTAKTGDCTLTVRLTMSGKHPSTSASRTLQVKRRAELNVLGAASLSDALTRIGEAFTSRFLHFSVRHSFAGSSTLATQVEQGAPVDIVALADTSTMKRLVDTGEIRASAVATLARNELAILVARGNPKQITNVRDLASGDLDVVLCDVAQPCGRYADIVLDRSGMGLQPASRESSASGVVSRVANGEADAGIAYVTDGLASRAVAVVRIPPATNVKAIYPIAGVRKPSTTDASGIAAFIAMARGSVGRAILDDLGFGLP